MDIRRADLELQCILSNSSIIINWDKITHIRNFYQKSLQDLLMVDIKFCEAENVEQHIWKIIYYNIIEILRKPVSNENAEVLEQYKKLLLKIVDEGTTYFTNLLSVLENTYNFKLDTFLTSSIPQKGLGILGLALVSAQKIFLFLGDLARYKELANESSNYGKSRQYVFFLFKINIFFNKLLEYF